MKTEPFTKTVQRFSIRKYSIGAASVFLGSVIFGGGPVQAAEQAAADVPEVKEGLSVEAQNEPAEALGTESPVVYPADATLGGAELPSPAPSGETLSSQTEDSRQATLVQSGSSTVAEPLKVEPVQARAIQEEPNSLGETVARTTASDQPETESTNSVSSEKPVAVEANPNQVVSEAGLSATEVTPAKPQAPIDLGVNGFTPNVVDPKFIVEIYGGTYFDRFENKGNQIILRQSNWNKFKGVGFSQEYNQEGQSGNYLLWFENPNFYNNIESIKVKTDSIYDVSLELTSSQDNQLWSIPVLKRFVSFPDDPNNTSDATNFPLTITLKDGKTVTELVGSQAVTFGSAFVSGDNYDRVFNINRLVVDTLNGAWFAADMPNRDAAQAETTVDSIFSDTKKRKTADSPSNQEVSEILPLVTEDGQVKGFKFITRYELVKGRSVLTEPAGTIPYIVQKLPAELMSLVDTNQVSLYASNAGGVGISKAIPLVVDGTGLVHTKNTPAISLEGVSSQEEAERRRQNLAPIFRPIIEEVKTPSVTLSGYYEPAAYTIEYTLKNPLSRAEFAAQIAAIADASGASALAETWKERGVMVGSSQSAGIMRNTYSNSYMDRSVLQVENKLSGQMTQADLYEGHYPVLDIQIGKSEVVPQTGQVPRGTQFSVISDNRSQIEFDGQGNATVTTPATEKPGRTAYTVQVRYPDGSTERLVLTVNRIPATNEEAERYNPSYTPATVEAGNQVVLEGQGLPSSASYSVTGSGMTIDSQGRVTVAVPLDAVSGPVHGQVTVRYSDGSEDLVPVMVQVTAKPAAERYNPSYETAHVQAGDQVVLEGQGLPSSARYSVTGSGMTVDSQGRVTVVVPADAATGSLTGQVTVRYSDGSEDLVPVTVQVTAKPAAERYNPSYTPATVEAGNQVVLEGQGLPSSASYSVTGSGMTVDSQGRVTVIVPADAATGSLTGQVTVRYSDGSEDLVPVMVQVTAKPAAERYNPSYTPATVEAGNQVVLEGQGLPSSASYSVTGSGMTIDSQGRVTVAVPLDAVSGPVHGQVTVRYSDGSEDLVPVTVQVTAKPAAERYNPSYTPATVEAGNQVVLEGQGLPSSASYSVTGSGMTIDSQGRVTVAVPLDAVSGPVHGQVTVRYSDGSEDLVPVTVQVTAKPEAERYNPSYTPATVEAGNQVVLEGQGLPSSASYSVTGSGMTVDSQGRVTVVVPADAATGSLTGQVTVRYSDGSEDLVPVTVQVTAKPAAERYNPSYTPATVEAGNQVVLEGQGLPSSASYSVTGSGMTVDSQGRVTVVVPADAQTGSLQGRVTVRYGDGSEDVVPLTIQVIARPLAEVYNPVYTPISLQAGTMGRLGVEGLPERATYRVSGEGMTIDDFGRVTVTIPDDAPTGTRTGQVTITYADGSEDLVPVFVQVTARPVVEWEADRYNPSYETAHVQAGSHVVLEGQGLPDQATYTIVGTGMTVDNQGRVTVAVSEDSATGTLTGNVTVRYSDGSSDVVRVTVQVTARPLAEFYAPSYTTATLQQGGTMTLGSQGFPVEASYQVYGDYMAVDDRGRVTVSLPVDAPIGGLAGLVTVTYLDGSQDQVPVQITVTARPEISREADRYNPSYPESALQAGQQVMVEGQDLPEQAAYTIVGTGMTVDDQGRVTIKVDETSGSGTLRGVVTVTYSDGSQDQTAVTVQVTARPLAERYNPNYSPITVEAGNQVILGSQGLPREATYQIEGEGMRVDAQGQVTVDIPADTPAGDRTGQVTITYRDGSQDRVSVVVHVTAKPVVTPDADKYNPSYPSLEGEQGSLVELEGQGLPEQARYRIVGSGMRVDPYGLVSVPIPSDAAVGSLITGQLTIRYADGSEDLIPITVRVKELSRSEAEKFDPSYDLMEVQAGEEILIEGNNLPSSARYSISGSGMTVDAQGRVRVSVPADAVDGTLEGQVTVHYTDGSEDLVEVRVIVIAKPVEPEKPEIPESDRYNPSYATATVQAGNQVVLEGQGLPSQATYSVDGLGMTVDDQGRVTVVVPADAASGSLTGQVIVRYKDGSEDRVVVTVEVVAKPVDPDKPVTPVEPEKPVIPEADRYNPSYVAVEVAAGTQVTIPGVNLPTSASYRIEGTGMTVGSNGWVTVVVPADAKSGSLTGYVTVRYNDGSEDRVPVTVTVKETAKPVDPEKPVTPVEPDKPVIPVDPEKPVTPVEPDKPVIPVDPEKPVTPVEPDKPVIPVDPEKPVAPVGPEKPVTPVVPEEPGVPSEREEAIVTPLVMPSHGAQLESVTGQQTDLSAAQMPVEEELPNTGEVRHPLMRFLVWLLSLVGFGFLFQKKKEEE
ncbi:YPDG domain-containing protein [Streptococcus sp. 121]|uniref:Rib/alpha-like domain-containing protein n=1 Tax=Streptococcus sp. 121 TaxID=2797637 RepID=UPI0018F0F0C2|nr:Rib/alpha-like domain-containing protein [Streptococcus sp. 121]MBJ6745022.1 YPDG domain-containing protein [Streptococcus sp. 121]